MCCNISFFPPRTPLPEIISFIPAIEEFQIFAFILQHNQVQYKCRNKKILSDANMFIKQEMKKGSSRAPAR